MSAKHKEYPPDFEQIWNNLAHYLPSSVPAPDLESRFWARFDRELQSEELRRQQLHHSKIVEVQTRTVQGSLAKIREQIAPRHREYSFIRWLMWPLEGAAIAALLIWVLWPQFAIRDAVLISPATQITSNKDSNSQQFLEHEIFLHGRESSSEVHTTSIPEAVPQQAQFYRDLELWQNLELLEQMDLLEKLPQLAQGS